MSERYEVTVEPTGFEGLEPTYEAMLYVFREGGVCGPFSERIEFTGMDRLRMVLAGLGFKRVGEFGEVCANGFASATVVPL